ncbi:hypothetical protein [Actinoallomurus rhizosphaericola]|uniref:hypothetical protein n=1 Tax=Actinoallomurus rhizosphaericola TaxID=2952536 RepID=UPI002090DE3B|nr:hypothetical protein [Actinoallomurus rhizosphaericola]MCO5993920.1 hypothetical protein [Actinoallomurus rhizosphaericola]
MHPRARVAGYVTAAVLVAVGTLWAIGGLDPADTPVPTPPGREVDQHLFRTRLIGAHVATVKKFGQSTRMLVINAWVTNPTRETLGTYGLDDDVFAHGMFLHWRTQDGPRPKQVDAQAIAGDTLFRSLQPRLPTYVAVQYELASGARVPDHVTVALADYEHTESGVLDPRGYWEWKARRYQTRYETNPLTHRSGRVTHIIPVLVADVRLPVRS